MGTALSSLETLKPLRRWHQITAMMARPAPAMNSPMAVSAVFHVSCRKLNQIRSDPTLLNVAPATPEAPLPANGILRRSAISATAEDAMPIPTKSHICSELRRTLIFATRPHEKNEQYIHASRSPNPKASRQLCCASFIACPPVCFENASCLQCNAPLAMTLSSASRQGLRRKR